MSARRELQIIRRFHDVATISALLAGTDGNATKSLIS